MRYSCSSLSVLLLLLASHAALGAIDTPTPTMTIEGRLQFPDKSPFNTTTRISVNHGAYMTYSRRDGNFTVHDVPPGIYLIDVHSPNYHFSQVKCQYKPEAIDEGKPVFSCLEYLYPGSPKQVVDKLLVITAVATYEYFEVKRGFSIMSILKNPMLLMMAFTVGMLYIMPKMMENLEPEERERMHKQMALQQDPSKMLGELFGGFSGEAEAKSPSKKIKK
jgi:ER membrane protein complex subunit 7